jgi:Transposase DDE domain group 1
MATECSQDSFDFGTVEGRSVVGAFDGGVISSEAGALLLGATDRAIRLVGRFAACFNDGRDRESIEHTVRTLVGQRLFAMALGYEDLNDHDELRHDPVMAVLAGKLRARRKRCAPVAGKSTLSRLEHAPEEGVAFAPPRYHKISHDARAIEALFLTLFLEAHPRAPKQITLDLDATDSPLHGHQEGRFFHGYYDCYCYLPLYIFCGRHLLAAKLRRSNIDASAGAREEVARLVSQIRSRWPKVQIWLRADSGFAREELMTWCEENGVEYVFGLARNDRLVAQIGPELKAAEKEAKETSAPARYFKEFMWETLESWSRKRRVIGKAEWTKGEANPRFIVTSLHRSKSSAQALYEDIYCQRGDMENRIKECQGDLFADRTPAATMRANQLRLWFASMAYVLMCALRRIGLADTELARATCGTIRLKLLKIGAQITISVRRVKIAFASSHPCQRMFALAHTRLRQVAA